MSRGAPLPVRARLVRAWHHLIAAWDNVQVELHGVYSVQRMQALHDYSTRTSGMRTLLVILLTPLPCLAAVAIADSIPMQPPELGIAESTGFWYRATFASWVYTFSIMEQLRYFVPALPLSGLKTFLLSIPVTFLTNGTTFLLAWAIVYPLPFTIPVLSMPWATFMVGTLWLQLRSYFRDHPEIRKQTAQFLLVATCQLSLLLIYPAYNYVFVHLSSSAQTAFALLLPVIKLVEKNLMSFFLWQLDDLKPEIIIFNVEIFNALFISCCMQNSNSIGTNIVLVGVDFVMACISLRDLDLMLVEVIRLADKIGISKAELIETALVISRANPRMEHQISMHLLQEKMDRTNSRRKSTVSGIASRVSSLHLPARLGAFMPRLLSRRSLTAKTHPELTMQNQVPGVCRTDTTPFNAIAPAPRVSLTSKTSAPPVLAEQETLSPPAQSSNDDKSVRVSSTIASSTASRGTFASFLQGVTPSSRSERTTTGKHRPVSIVELLDEDERMLFLEKALQTLHMTEYLLLIEYTEVMIPMVYTLYLLVLFHLPNRVYYPQLRDMDEAKLRHTMGNVMMNAICEFVSLILLACVLAKKLQTSPFRQLAFVLDRQWRMVQSKLVLWVVVTLQTSLQHLGADYSFRFEWLHRQPTS